MGFIFFIGGCEGFIDFFKWYWKFVNGDLVECKDFNIVVFELNVKCEYNENVDLNEMDFIKLYYYVYVYVKDIVFKFIGC